MKALVTGATGFIGSHVADRLIGAGMDVRIITRKSSNNKWLDNNKIERIDVELDDKAGLVKAMKDVNYVFHIAGLNFAKNKDDFKNINTLGTGKMLNAVYESGADIKRFVYVSSQTATGPSPDFEHPVDENSPRNPVTAYGLSKKLAEDEVMKYIGKIPFTILKPPAVFGPRDLAIFNLFKMMYFGFAAHIGFSKKYVSLIHSEDLSRGIVDAALAEIAQNQSYILTNNDFYHWDYISDVFKVQMNKKFYFKVKVPDPIVLTVGAFNGLISNIFNVQMKFDYDKSIDFTRKYWTCTAAKAKKDFGFEQLVPFEDAVKSTFDWYKFHKWL